MVYLLVQRWSEPESGSAVHTVALDDREAADVRGAIAWLRERGGEKVGGALPRFDLIPEPEPNSGEDVEYTGLGEVMGLLAVESRYEEDRGFYGETERHDGLEAACQSDGYWPA